MEQENHNTEGQDGFKRYYLQFLYLYYIENVNIFIILVQLKKLKKGNSPAAICNLQGQGIIALVAFVSGYLIHYTGFI